MRPAALALLFLAGCRPAPPPVAPAPVPAEGPRRIVSVAPAMTEILFAVGAGDRVVGVTDLCDYPAAAKLLPKVGGFGPRALSPEVILARNPDLLVTAGRYQKPVADAVKLAGVRVYGAEPASFAEVCKAVRDVGRITGNEERAGEVAAGIEGVLNDYRARPRLDTPPRVLVVVGTDPLICVGPGTFLAEMLDLAGAANVVTVGTPYPKLSDEAVLTNPPDVILIPDNMGAGSAAALAARPGWGRLPAVANNKVRTVPGDLVSRPGPRLVDGLAAVRAAVRE